MPTFDYAGLAESIWADFREFGHRAYLRKPGEKSGDAWNQTEGTPRDWPITVLEIRKRVRDAEGNLVEAAGYSLKVSTEGLDLVQPEKGDTIMIGPGTYPEEMTEHQIAEIRPIAPGGIVVVYDIDLER